VTVVKKIWVFVTSTGKVTSVVLAASLYHSTVLSVEFVIPVTSSLKEVRSTANAIAVPGLVSQIGRILSSTSGNGLTVTKTSSVVSRHAPGNPSFSLLTVQVKVVLAVRPVTVVVGSLTSATPAIGVHDP